MTVRPVELDDLLTPAQKQRLARRLIHLLQSEYGEVIIRAKQGKIIGIALTDWSDVSQLPWLEHTPGELTDGDKIG